jgi:Zn-dependent M28 family amino/carboxypeptidase
MRRKTLGALTTASLLAVAVGTAAAAAQEAATAAAAGTTASSSALRPNDDIRLRKALTVQGILQHERALDRIGKRNNDTRASGTTGYDASVAYVVGRLEKAGYNVETQTFDFPFFQETAEPTLAQTAPSPKTYVAGTDFATFQYSGSGSVSGPLVPTNDIVIPPSPEPSSTSGCEAEDYPAPPAPTSVALIQRGTCTFGEKAAAAKAAGYAAAVIFNEGQEGRQELLVGTLGAPETIPVLGTTFAVGQELFELARMTQVTVSLSASTLNENRPTENVIADTVGGDPDRIVVVGAHLDSVLEGPGVNDNGSGSSTILETALQISRLNLTLRNKVRFAFWGAEENGLLGSTHYVSQLSEAERAAIELNLNFDMLGSPNFVRFVYDGDGSATPDDPEDAGPAGSDVIEQVFVNYFDVQGLETEPTAFDGRSDYGPFIEVGIPAGGLFSGAEGVKTEEEAQIYGGTAGEPYDPCYHEACDDIDNLSKEALDQLGDGVAHAVLTFANRREPLGAVPEAQVAAALQASRSLPYRGDRLQR